MSSSINQSPNAAPSYRFLDQIKRSGQVALKYVLPGVAFTGAIGVLTSQARTSDKQPSKALSLTGDSKSSLDVISPLHVRPHHVDPLLSGAPYIPSKWNRHPVLPSTGTRRLRGTAEIPPIIVPQNSGNLTQIFKPWQLSTQGINIDGISGEGVESQGYLPVASLIFDTAIP